MYARYPLPLRKVEHPLPERGIEISHKSDRFWWHRFGRMYVDETRCQHLLE
jgi:putative transposase